MLTRKYLPLKIGESVSYVPMSKDLGRAEFVFCPVFNEKGLLKKVYISSMQQKEGKNYLIRVQGKLDLFYLTDYSEPIPYGGARHWMGGWCKEHKTIFQRWYVGPQSTKMTPRVSCEALQIYLDK